MKPIKTPKGATTDVMQANLLIGRGANITKRTRFTERCKEMLGGGTWVYYPEEDRFEEIVSIMHPWVARQVLPNYQGGADPRRFMPSLTIYGREVYEAEPEQWKLFMMGDPRAVLLLSSEFNEASEGGLLDVDAFAVQREGNVS